MNRQALIKRLKGYNAIGVPEIGYAIEEISASSDESISNEEVKGVWGWVSKALDHSYSDDCEHDAWSLEVELSVVYSRSS